jgi:hypothetical protein
MANMYALVRNSPGGICFCEAHPVVNSTLLFLLVLIVSKAMPIVRQRDHTAGKVERRSMGWAIIGAEMAKRRVNIDSAFASTSAICAVMTLYTKAKENRDNHIRRSKRLSISDFHSTLTAFLNQII